MTQTPPEDEPMLTTLEAAVQLNISRRMVYELISQGAIETIRIPSSRTPGRPGEHRIEAAEIQRFKDRNRQRGAA